MMEGKIQPNATELEVVVLGSLLIDNRAINEVGDILISEMFYKPEHKIIYQAIITLHTNSSHIDLITITQQLKKEGNLEKVGGAVYIIELTQSVSSSAHIEFNSRIIIQKYIQRQLIQKSTETIETAFKVDADVFELIDTAYSNLNAISEKSIKTQDALLSDLIDTQINRGVKIYAGDIKAGLTTPIARLTEKTGGWRDSELIILAARPGMGKTAFILKSCLHIAMQNIPVAIFSLEMSKEKLTDRLLSMEARVESDKFNIHGLSQYDMELINPVSVKLKSIPLIIDDNPSLTITQFQIKAKRLKNKFGVKFIVVDYLQLMATESKGGNREQEISKISRGLKVTAKELNIPIIALSQLSRAVEQRGGSKRPLLSDLRESGAIEQDADMVMFLYRPEYYGITEWDDYDGEQTKGECEYIVAKNRNGGLIRNRMQFEGKYTLFSDLEEGLYNINAELLGISPNDAFEKDDTPF
jgi:replicative DNA helicase